MATKQLRCIAEALNIRSSPRMGSDNKTGDQLKFSEIITVDLDSRKEADGVVWLKHDRGWSVERSLDNRQLYLVDALTPRERVFGINIDPNNPKGNPPADRLFGAGWVRFVFHVNSRHQTLEQVYTFYDPIIRSYAQTGTRILLILLQDTFWGNGPWDAGSNGDWRLYARGFGERAGQIARHYRGQVTAYQIWNEEDVSGQPTSIFVNPQNYALILLSAVQAIAQADPSAQVITGGLAAATDASIEYMKQVRTALGGVLPVDGIAIHPYGQTASVPDAEPFPDFSRGLLKRTLIKFADTFLGYPIWITEFGVPRVNVSDKSLWPNIARYMDKTIDYIRAEFNHLVPAFIWFAWSDDMDNAGIVSNDQQPKGEIFTQFFNNVLSDYPNVTKSPTPFDGKVTLAYLNGGTVSENSITELAERISSSAPSVGSILVRTSLGTTWQGRSDSKRNMAINAPADLARWSTELSRERLDLHAWHQVQARSVVEITNEINLITQIALSPGVSCVVLDLDATLGPRNSTAIRNFMVPLRRNLPPPYHIGLSFDGRPEFLQNITFSEWYPFLNSWHPRITIPQTGAAAANPYQYLNAVCNFLKPFRKPILPMISLEPVSGRPIPAEQVRLVAQAAFDVHNCQGISFWRLGLFGTGEYDAIRSINVSMMGGYTVRAPLGTVTVKVNGVRIRTVPSLTGDVLGQLQLNEQITVLERRVLGGFEWVRFDRGWSASRNTTTGETFMS
ncbi:MAG: hypothetical protein KF716_29640 [Anaerolineae bacterium]|nr:hypothetical protein [Anaerolineae bacterium]